MGADKVVGKIFNAGYENHTVSKLAETVQSVIGEDVKLVKTQADDQRSYHISSEKIAQVLGFFPQHTIREAVKI